MAFVSPPARYVLASIVAAALLPADLVRYYARPRRPLPLFIVGCGNSGTTLLRVILGHHDDVYATPLESGFMLAQAPTRRGRVLAMLRRRPVLRAIELGEPARRDDRGFWLEKTPRHVHFTRFLLAMDRRAKVIFMTRQPLDVIASLIRRGYSFERALDRWVSDNKVGLGGLLSSDRVVGFSYEGLVADPESSVRLLCDRIGLEYHDYLLNYASVRQTVESAKITTEPTMASHWKRRQRQVNEPITDRTNSWHGTLSEAQVRLIEERTRELQQDLMAALS